MPDNVKTVEDVVPHGPHGWGCLLRTFALDFPASIYSLDVSYRSGATSAPNRSASGITPRNGAGLAFPPGHGGKHETHCVCLCCTVFVASAYPGGLRPIQSSGSRHPGAP